MMPPARMDFGNVLKGASWLDVLGFVVGLVCLFAGIALLHSRFPPSGRGARFGLFALVTAGLLAVAFGTDSAIRTAGYEPAGWLARFGSAWAWGVGLFGGGSAVAALQRADPTEYPDPPPPDGRRRRRKGRR